MLMYALPTMFGVAAARMALFTALGLPPWPSPMYLQCMATMLSAEALSCSQAGWSTAPCQRLESCQRQQQYGQMQVRLASSCFFIHLRPGKVQVLLRRPQGAPSAGPGLPPSWPGKDQHLNIWAWASAYMAATPATWGVAKEVPWPQV